MDTCLQILKFLVPKIYIKRNILNILIKRHRFRKEAERSAHIVIFDSQNFIIQPEINQ